MGTISGRRPLEGAAVGAGGVAALTAAAPGSSAASARPLASRFGRLWFPNWRRLIGTAGPGLLIAVGYIDPGNWATMPETVWIRFSVDGVLGLAGSTGWQKRWLRFRLMIERGPVCTEN